jgi:hypothetical protein
MSRDLDRREVRSVPLDQSMIVLQAFHIASGIEWGRLRIALVWGNSDC